jgi:hypothetical protein
MQARRTTTVAIGMGAAASLLVAVAATAHSESMDLAVVEHATTDIVIDVGEPGDTIGDMLGFGNELYDEANATVVGRSQGQCFRSNPGLSWECTWTNVMEEGSITVQGPFYDDLRDVELAITGGTGVYEGAAGTMTLHARDELGSELDFVFHLSPAASMGMGHRADDDGSDDSSKDDGSDESDS